MTNALAPIALAAFLSIVHLASQWLARRLVQFHVSLVSFSAGAFLALLFLDFLPRALADNVAYAFLFAGFAIFHVAEKYVYQHALPSHRRRDIGLLEFGGFFLVNLIDGLLLVLAYRIEPALAALLFVPLFMHKLASAPALEHLLERVPRHRPVRTLLSASTLAGAVLATPIPLSSTAFLHVFALALGAVLYVSIRNLLPRGANGRSTYFLLGALFTIAVLQLFVGLY